MERLIDLPERSIRLEWLLGGTSSDLIRQGNAYERLQFFNPIVQTGNAGLYSCETLILRIPSLNNMLILAIGEGNVSIQSNATQ